MEEKTSKKEETIKLIEGFQAEAYERFYKQVAYSPNPSGKVSVKAQDKVELLMGLLEVLQSLPEERFAVLNVS